MKGYWVVHRISSKAKVTALGAVLLKQCSKSHQRIGGDADTSTALPGPTPQVALLMLNTGGHV